MIRKNIRLISAAAAAAMLLCSCGGNGMTKEFAELKEIAEGKSGIVYRTTIFAEAEGSDGFPYPQKNDSGEVRFVYKDENGKVTALTAYAFSDARSSYGVDETVYFAPACYNGEWGYALLNTAAPSTDAVTWVIAPQYENAEPFSEQLAAVQKDGKYGAINENGELVIPFMYDSLKYRAFTLMPAELDGEWYFIDGGNNRVYGPFEDAESYAYGYAAVKKGGKWGYIDKNGFDATAFVYDEAYSLDGGGSAWVRTGDNWERVVVTKK